MSKEGWIPNILKYIIHNNTDNLFEWVDKFLPLEIKKWLVQTRSGRILSGVLGGGAIGFGKMFPNTPWWTLLDTAINSFSTEFNDYLKKLRKEGIKPTKDNIEPQLQNGYDKHIAPVVATIEKGFLFAGKECVCELGSWLCELSVPERQKAIRYLSGLYKKETLGFVAMRPTDRTAYLEGLFYEEPKEEEKGPGFIERQRKEMDASTNKIIWATVVKEYVEDERLKQKIEELKMKNAQQPKRQRKFSFWELVPVVGAIIRWRRKRAQKRQEERERQENETEARFQNEETTHFIGELQTDPYFHEAETQVAFNPHVYSPPIADIRPHTEFILVESSDIIEEYDVDEYDNTCQYQSEDRTAIASQSEVLGLLIEDYLKGTEE